MLVSESLIFFLPLAPEEQVGVGAGAAAAAAGAAAVVAFNFFEGRPGEDEGPSKVVEEERGAEEGGD